MGRHRATRYTERLAEAGIEPSLGSVGDRCALAETVIGPWRGLEDVEIATLEPPASAGRGLVL